MSGFFTGVRVTDLVPGSPGDLYDLSTQLLILGTGLEDAAHTLGSIKSGSWKGIAADAFRNVMQQQPGRYSSAGGAFKGAGNAIQRYAAALEDAQRTATTAIGIWEDAERATRTWTASGGAAGGVATDPGQAGRDQAETLLTQALHTLGQAAATVVSAVRNHAQGAPSKPGLLGDVWGGVTSFGSAMAHGGEQFVEGIWTGAKDMVTGLVSLAAFAWSISPARMLIDPSGWEKSVESTGETIYKIGTYAVHHPASFAEHLGSAILNLHEWETDPAKAAGELVPSILLTVATLGAGASVDAASDAADMIDESATAVTEAADAADETAAETASTARMYATAVHNAAQDARETASVADQLAENAADQHLSQAEELAQRARVLTNASAATAQDAVNANEAADQAAQAAGEVAKASSGARTAAAALTEQANQLRQAAEPLKGAEIAMDTVSHLDDIHDDAVDVEQAAGTNVKT